MESASRLKTMATTGRDAFASRASTSSTNRRRKRCDGWRRRPDHRKLHHADRGSGTSAQLDAHNPISLPETQQRPGGTSPSRPLFVAPGASVAPSWPLPGLTGRERSHRRILGRTLPGVPVETPLSSRVLGGFGAALRGYKGGASRERREGSTPW